MLERKSFKLLSLLIVFTMMFTMIVPAAVFAEKESELKLIATDEVTVEETVEETITLAPATGEATVIQGAELEASAVTLSSNYNATGLKTFISLKKGDTPVNFDAVFEEFNLATKVGDGEVDGPYNMVCADSSFQYGPSGGFAVEAGVDQVTITTGKVKADAPVGTYVITTKVRAGEEVLATAAYTLVVEKAPVPSTYDFSYEVPIGIVAGEEVEVEVIFATVEEGDFGYDGVRFAYEVTSAPEGATVTFTSADGQVKDLVLSQGEKGYWGPGDGFSIPADYEATTGWKLTFSADGTYEISFSLIDADTEEVIAGITASEEVKVLKAITEEDREQARDDLATKVAAKVDELTDIDEVDVAFDEESRKTTITILDEEGTILDLSGTGAMVLLAEMEEVRGYTLGETTRDFYDDEGNRVDMATIKGWIIEDALTALDLHVDISLGALIGKSFTVEVIGLDGRVDFTDEYTFEFVQDPDVIAANEVIALINELPGIDELTLYDKDKVEAARTAYEALTERQQTLVNNLDILENAETRISEIEADQAAEEQANTFKATYVDILNKNVDTIEISDKDAVEAALTAYGELPERTQLKLTDEKILLNGLLAKISELEAIESVITAINDLPTGDELTLEDKAAVVAARSAYEQLTEGQKGSIEQEILQKLELAESKITDLEQTALTELNGLISTASDRARPDYTASIPEWDTYWISFLNARDEAAQVYNVLEGKDKLTLEESTNLVASLQGLQRAMEILNGIEDFDASFGDRVSPKGCEKTINDQSRTSNGGNRLRAYYDEENSDFYWLLSGKLKEQNFYTGTSGTGLKTGLMRVMVSEPLIRAESGDYTIEIYKSNGTRKTEKELESDGMNLAIDWVGGLVNALTKKYSFLAGKSFDFKLIGQTSDGTEFQRSYTFHFIDAGLQEFDPDVDYCVVNGVVQPVIETYTVTFEVTEGEGTLTAEVDDTAIESGAEVEHDKDVVFTATPADGYRVKGWTLNNEAVAGNTTNNFTVEDLNEAIEVTVEFEEIPVVSATIEPTIIAFDKDETEQANVIITITWNSATSITAVKKGNDALTVDADYTVEGSTLTINKEYLAAQDAGQVVLSIEFDKGNAATLTITVNDTTSSEDQQAAKAVEQLISSLPGVEELSLDDREAVEKAEMEFNELTDPQKALVDSELVAKLNNALDKMADLVLTYMDERLLHAVNNLGYDGTGIEVVTYEDRTATFFIKDLDQTVIAFANSGVMELFGTMFEDVVAMRMNNGELIEVEQPLIAAAQIVSVLLELDPNNPDTGILLNATMADLNGKSINIELTILPGDKEYVGTYVVEFVFEGETDADAEEAAESDELTTDETVDTGVIPEDETKSDDTSEIGENEVKEIIEERAVETDGVEAEGDEEFVEETDNVEESGEENQETPVVEEDNEGVNDKAEVESGGEEDAA